MIKNENGKLRFKNFLLLAFKFLPLCFLLTLISYVSNGQSQFSNHYYFPNKYIASQSILQNVDGSYMLVGMADTSVAGAIGSQSGFLKKLDNSGNLLWTQYYNFSNAYNVYFNNIKKTLDGNYVVVGVIDFGFGVSLTFQDVFFAKLDTLGNILWMKYYGGVATDIGFDVLELSNGDFLIQSSFGEIVSLNAFNAFQLIRTNAIGDSLWTHQYYNYDGLEQFPASVDQTSDNGFCSVGMKLTGSGDSYGYIVKTDSGGIEQWNKVIDSTTFNELVGVTTGTNTITVFGNENIGAIEEPFIAELDLTGTINWFKTISEPNVHVSSMSKASDNGFALTGVERGGINNKVVLIKTDSVGNKLWKKSFPQLNMDLPSDIRQTLDSGYIITGNTVDNSILSFYIFALKTDDSLNVTSVPEQLFTINISVFPNPVDKYLHIKCNDFEIINAQKISIIDIMGKEVMKVSPKDVFNKAIDITPIKSGLYFLQISFVNREIPRLIKFVKL